MLVPADSRLEDTGHETELIEQARAAASRTLREAIEVCWICPVESADIPSAELRALIEQHGAVLALGILSQHDGSVSKRLVADLRDTRTWLGRVRKGEISLDPLSKKRTEGLRPLRVIGSKPARLGPNVFDIYAGQ